MDPPGVDRPAGTLPIAGTSRPQPESPTKSRFAGLAARAGKRARSTVNCFGASGRAPLEGDQVKMRFANNLLGITLALGLLALAQDLFDIYTNEVTLRAGPRIDRQAVEAVNVNFP